MYLLLLLIHTNAVMAGLIMLLVFKQYLHNLSYINIEAGFCPAFLMHKKGTATAVPQKTTNNNYCISEFL